MTIVVVGAREDDEVYELANKKVRKYKEKHEMNSRKGERETVPLFLLPFVGSKRTFGHISLQKLKIGVRQKNCSGKPSSSFCMEGGKTICFMTKIIVNYSVI